MAQTEQLRRRLWTPGHEARAMADGWNLWVVDRDGLTRYELQRLDESDVFDSDDTCLAHLTRVFNVDTTAKDALSILHHQGLGAWPGQPVVGIV